MARTRDKEATRRKLLDAAVHLFRLKGFASTTVDDICEEAKLTKGSFFHHFKSKEELGVEAAALFSAMSAEMFANAPFQSEADPRERVLGYLRFHRSKIAGEFAEFSCLHGTVVQEVYATSEPLRAACGNGISNHIQRVVGEIEAARELYAPEATWSAESMAQFAQSVLQGAFVLAKAEGGTAGARRSLDHLIRYVESELGRAK